MDFGHWDDFMGDCGFLSNETSFSDELYENEESEFKIYFLKDDFCE